MSFLDYMIILVVAALFVLAFCVYKKKPRCACGNGGGCSGDCSCCGAKCSEKKKDK